MSEIINKVLFHKRRRVPVLAIPSPDPITMVRDLQLALTAGNNPEGSNNVPVMVWDVVVGYTCGLKSTNEDGTNTITDDVSAAAWSQTGAAIRAMAQTARIKSIINCHENMGKATASAALDLAHEFPDGTVTIIKHVDTLLNGPSGHAVQQAIMNLRDTYANTNRTLILTDNDMVLPECLRNDTIVIDDSLPTRQQYVQSINMIAEAAGAEAPEDMDAIVDAVAGLPRFQAEQALALSLSSESRRYDLETLWAEKKKLVDQTRGLSVHYQGSGFESVGGLRGIKDYFTRLMRGPKPPQLIVWIDEIEKSGIAHTNDTNGINADALGLLLSHIEDHNSYCVSLTGLPGTGKSLVAKTVGAQFGRLVIRMDMGAMKGAYVGQSIHPDEEIYVSRNKNGYDSHRFTMQEFHKLWESGDRNWYTWTHSKVGGSIVSKVNDSIKHDRSVRFVKITTRSGREVIATENHSVFTKKRHLAEVGAASRSFNAMLDLASEGGEALRLHREEGIFEEAEAGNLQVGDKIAIAGKYTTNGRNKSNYKVSVGGITVEATPDFCQLLGLWLADGSWLGNALRISFNKNERESIEFTKRMFGGDQCKEYTKGTNSIDLYTSENHWIALAFRALGVNGKSRTKRVPAWVIGLPLDSQRALLRGYFNGDGCVQEHVVEASTMSKNLASDIVRVLGSVGVFARCRSKYIKTDRSILGKDYKLKEGKQYRIAISKGSELLTFRDHIGFISSHKQDALNEHLSAANICSYTKGTTNYGVMWDDVTAIEFVDGPEDCYDISVDETEKFVCGGVVVHNSESTLRSALRMIASLSSNNALFIATSNTVNALDTALRSRFVDTFYFPLPTEEELKPVWDIHKEKYEFFEDNPICDGWVPRNIKQCVEKAYRLGMTLEQAAATVIPTGVAMAKDVKKLNEQANGRFLSASTGETYEFDLAEIE